MQRTRLTSPATIRFIPDANADRRLTSTEGLAIGDEVEHMQSERKVRIVAVGRDWLEVRGRGGLMVRKVYCFARITI